MLTQYTLHCYCTCIHAEKISTSTCTYPCMSRDHIFPLFDFSSPSYVLTDQDDTILYGIKQVPVLYVLMISCLGYWMHCSTSEWLEVHIVSVIPPVVCMDARRRHGLNTGCTLCVQRAHFSRHLFHLMPSGFSRAIHAKMWGTCGSNLIRVPPERR